MNLSHDPKGWARVAKMALRDIAKLTAEIERLKSELDRTERNRDMWKGQCERQAEQLTAMHALPSSDQS